MTGSWQMPQIHFVAIKDDLGVNRLYEETTLASAAC